MNGTTKTNIKFEKYHNGSTKKPKAPPVEERKVIAWDLEGISLSGQDRPQHPVIFGCSAEYETPIISRRISSKRMIDYIMEINRKYPHAIHVGYAFRYDVNMILQDLPEPALRKLWSNGDLVIGEYYIKVVPGKFLLISKKKGKKHGRHLSSRYRQSVTIYDFSSFFGVSRFIKTAEDILRDELSPEDHETIEHGKAARGSNTWDDIDEVLYYWKKEIQLIERVFRRFRDVMCQASFPLQDWYGPGALANFINARYQIKPKLAAAQTTSGHMPAEVHMASKIAFSGGRIEHFYGGRIQGPIHCIDINGAYPYALSLIPSLEPSNGEWVHVDKPSKIARFGFYRIRFRASDFNSIEYRPMPLFWRNNKGLITYPNATHGWYASPEAAVARNIPGVEILEGWEWVHNDTESPWSFLHDMYETRQRLGKANIMSLPFKLGPNSLYGKYAQTVGWNRKTCEPPKSHALPIAAWITSYTRAKLYTAMGPMLGNVIGVETDSIFFTGDVDLSRVVMGDQLGEWSYTQYDEIVYTQTGMYHTKKNGEWKGVKSRGMNSAEYSIERVESWLSSMEPWHYQSKLEIVTNPRFIGAGAAFQSAEPFKDIHCSWRPQPREISFGETGKRRHYPFACRACQDKQTPWEAPHDFAINFQSGSDGNVLSAARVLPWEVAQISRELSQLRLGEAIESELLE